MKIENLDLAVRLSRFRDRLLSMKDNLSPNNSERRLRVQLHTKPDDICDDVSSDDRLLDLVREAIDVRIKEIERAIKEIE